MSDEINSYLYITMLLVLLNAILLSLLHTINKRLEALEEEAARNHHRNFGLSWA